MATRNPVVTVLLPWHSKAAFEAFCTASASCDERNSLYAAWEEHARFEVSSCLSEGRAVELVSVGQDDFQRWLAAHAADDTPDNRVRFIEDLTQQRHTD